MGKEVALGIIAQVSILVAMYVFEFPKNEFTHCVHSLLAIHDIMECKLSFSFGVRAHQIPVIPFSYQHLSAINTIVYGGYQRLFLRCLPHKRTLIALFVPVFVIDIRVPIA